MNHNLFGTKTVTSLSVRTVTFTVFLADKFNNWYKNKILIIQCNVFHSDTFIKLTTGASTIRSFPGLFVTVSISTSIFKIFQKLFIIFCILISGLMWYEYYLNFYTSILVFICIWYFKLLGIYLTIWVRGLILITSWITWIELFSLWNIRLPLQYTWLM